MFTWTEIKRDFLHLGIFILLQLISGAKNVIDAVIVSELRSDRVYGGKMGSRGKMGNLRNSGNIYL